MDREVQCARVLSYMKENGSITAAEAWFHIGIGRLSARIYDLRDRGYNIRSRQQEDVNKYGDNIKYAVYYISRGRKPKSRQFPNAPKKKDYLGKNRKVIKHK